MRQYLPIVVTVIALGALAAHRREARAGDSTAGAPQDPRRAALIGAHQFVPRNELVDTTALHRELLTELKARYHRQLDALKQEVAASGARLVLAYLTTEFESDAQKALEPFIRATAAEMGIEYVNLTTRLRGVDPQVITQMPRDGHWSAQGAALAAEALADVLARHADARSDITLPDSVRPALFGDLAPGQDVILDGGKDLPYRLRTNRQGLRLDHDLAFPAPRQRVLLLGDSQLHCPFLDNPATIAAQLQRLWPASEIVPATNLGYGLDDLASLYRERARFVEPDLVIVQTSGGDVFDTYFSHRNLFSRGPGPFEPTELELRYERATMGSTRDR